MMNDLILYAQKVVLFHSACYFVYWSVLRRSNHFSLNRVYLLCTLILGFVAPLVTTPLYGLPVDQVIPELDLARGQFLEAGSGSTTDSSLQNRYPYATVFDLVLLIYIVGVVILIIRSVLSLRFIFRIKSQGVESPRTSPKVILIKEPMSFSFMNIIVLNEASSPFIFLHEKCHVIGKHWFDLFITEIICILCWMNPLVWLYRKSLKQQHEYLADDYVLNNGVSQEEYLICILNSLSYQDSGGPVHRFNSHSLKQRICMITKEKLLPLPKLIYIALVPMVALLFLSFSGSKVIEGSVDNSKVFVIDAAHGGTDAGASSPSGLAEKDIALSVAQLVHDIGKAKGLNILLTRTGDETVSLKDRIAFSIAENADVFLSLHLGFDATNEHNGIGMFISEQNTKYEGCKRIASVLNKELSDINELANPTVVNFNAAVLKQTPAPSVIVEVGYLSNEQDVSYITNPMNQRKIAEKIVNGLLKY